MTETNINALCSVEAVFNGLDIEVTVEFSAGGGTFEHDELTAESRAKADQHPIPSITGLQSALDGKANSSHVHNISDVTGLQSALDGKSSVVEHNDLTGRDASDVHPKESITGLKIADSPEFADTQITSLATEATYSASVWSYLVGLFTTVPKSVKEHIVKIWERLGLLEDKYILKYLVPVDSDIIELTTDKNGNNLNITSDFSIELLICGGGLSVNAGTIFLNEITADGTYYNSYNNVSGYNGINYRCGSMFHKTLVDVKFTGNKIAWISQSGGINSDNSSQVQFHVGHSLIDVPHISKFTIKESLGSKTILAGSIITIKKK